MTQTEPLITFAIPYYSNLNYLKRAIDSVLKQSVSAWCIIVCDDGNVDESAEDLVKSYGHWHSGWTTLELGSLMNHAHLEIQCHHS